MNNNQIVFIICANNELYYNECIRYIEEVEVPEGYSVDTICIQEAESMAQGYNAGMQASDAKYKVYLHQDTFILNKKFIYEIIEIFNCDEEIGMLGVIGADGQLCDAAMKKAYMEVNAIKGFLMVTQYDVPWREDISRGWDLYDVSQSSEMHRNGYKVVVPYQEKPWCYHDGGTGAVQEKTQELLQLEIIRQNLILLMENGEYEKLSEAAEEIRELWPLDMQIRTIADLMEIYYMEENSIHKKHSAMFQCNSWEVVYEYYTWIRFILMRLEYAREDERIEELKAKLDEGEITKDVIRKISDFSLEYLVKEEKEEPLVSVVVAVYNGEDTIADTLDSILNQTYKNLEVIVVDDASTDNSREIISGYKDSRIKTVFLEKNRHVCYAGNVGFQTAEGKYVALIGHDDIWEKDKIEKQILFMEEHPSYSVCFTQVNIIDEERNIINEREKILYDIFCGKNHSQDYWLRRLSLRGNHFCAPSACIRREFLEKTGLYRYGLVQLQDYDLWMRLLCEGPIHILPEKLTQYRRFVKTGQNLSVVNRETRNRDNHERQWAQDALIDKLSAEDFVRVFGRDMQNPQAFGEKEILCEKVFFLRKVRNCFFVKRCIELLEDEECRNILEEKYNFNLTDFYKMNTEPIFFDSSLLEKVQEQERLIEHYKQMQG